MVVRDIEARGITDPRVLDALRTVPRERFLPTELGEFAYDDTPLPIEEGQTISQPFIVASMAEAAELTATSRVLEIGAGSGYSAAVLGLVSGRVWTIERHEPLATRARQRIDDLDYDNIHVIVGDGTLGLPEEAPFDAIIVTAGGPSVPDALIEQLADGGRIVIPVGTDARAQRLLRIRRRGTDITEEDFGAVRFVPLIGAQGWEPPEGQSSPIPSDCEHDATAVRHRR